MHTLFVCTTCKKRDGDNIIDPHAGQYLFNELNALENLPSDMMIQGVECLSACKKACALAFTAPEKYSYIFADLDPTHVNDIVTLAHTYSEKEDGILKKINRPDALKNKAQGRIPPLLTIKTS